MEYVEGHDLEELLRRRRGAPLVLDEALAILDAVCRGVQAVHSAGAVHGCALFCQDELLMFVEDVGRHNALDKTLGAMLRAGGRPDGALVVTSRASFEMVQKAAALGFGILAAVSAPTAAAVRLAQRLNITLVGFLRDDDCAVYSHPEKLAGLER